MTLPAKSGIYRITNTINGLFYIGSAKRFQHRQAQHLYDLRKNKHRNAHLQHAFSLYGEQAFVFDVVEIVDDLSLLTEREQYYIDSLRPPYNIIPTARSQFGFKHSETSRKKMSESAKKRKIHGHTGHSHTSETLEVIKEKRRMHKPTQLQLDALLAQSYAPKSEEQKRRASENNKGKHSDIWEKRRRNLAIRNKKT